MCRTKSLALLERVDEQDQGRGKGKSRLLTLPSVTLFPTSQHIWLPGPSSYEFLSLVTGEEVLQASVPVLPVLQHAAVLLRLAHVAVPGLLLFYSGRCPSPHQHIQTLHTEAPAQTTTAVLVTPATPLGHPSSSWSLSCHALEPQHFTGYFSRQYPGF